MLKCHSGQAHWQMTNGAEVSFRCAASYSAVEEKVGN